MMYTKSQFGKDLRKRALEKQGIANIGRWIYSIYLDWPDVEDDLNS